LEVGRAGTGRRGCFRRHSALDPAQARLARASLQPFPLLCAFCAAASSARRCPSLPEAPSPGPPPPPLTSPTRHSAVAANRLLRPEATSKSDWAAGPELRNTPCKLYSADAIVASICRQQLTLGWDSRRPTIEGMHISRPVHRSTFDAAPSTLARSCFWRTKQLGAAGKDKANLQPSGLLASLGRLLLHD